VWLNFFNINKNLGRSKRNRQREGRGREKEGRGGGRKFGLRMRTLWESITGSGKLVNRKWRTAALGCSFAGEGACSTS
jgi:hypothetical protein